MVLKYRTNIKHDENMKLVKVYHCTFMYILQLNQIYFTTTTD